MLCYSNIHCVGNHVLLMIHCIYGPFDECYESLHGYQMAYLSEAS